MEIVSPTVGAAIRKRKEGSSVDDNEVLRTISANEVRRPFRIGWVDFNLKAVRPRSARAMWKSDWEVNAICAAEFAPLNSVS